MVNLNSINPKIRDSVVNLTLLYFWLACHAALDAASSKIDFKERERSRQDWGSAPENGQN